MEARPEPRAPGDPRAREATGRPGVRGRAGLVALRPPPGGTSAAAGPPSKLAAARAGRRALGVLPREGAPRGTDTGGPPQPDAGDPDRVPAWPPRPSRCDQCPPLPG